MYACIHIIYIWVYTTVTWIYTIRYVQHTYIIHKYIVVYIWIYTKKYIQKNIYKSAYGYIWIHTTMHMDMYNKILVIYKN